MSGSKKWKSKLLSSSFPLEYEVAKSLVAEGFSVSFDFTYCRNDNGTLKDFSVDILGVGEPPFLDPNQSDADLDLLIECKYRDENVR